MDQLKEFVSVTSISTLPASLSDFVTKYDAPGALSPPTTSAEVTTLLQVIDTFIKILADYCQDPLKLNEWHLSDLHLADITSLGHVYNALKIFTRLGKDHFVACYTVDNVKNLLTIYQHAIQLSTALMTTPTNTTAADAPDAALVALTRLRIESSRVLQNMAILSSTNLANVIHKDDIIERLFNILRDGTFGHYGINAKVVQDALLFNNGQSLSIGQLIGLTDLSHVLRAVVHIVAVDSDLCFVKSGLLAELYKLFYKISNLKAITTDQLSDSTYQIPSNLGLYSPLLLDPRGVQMEFFYDVNSSVLTTPANQREPLHLQFRTIINDFSRIFIVYGAMGNSDSEEHENYIAVSCNGEAEGDDLKLLSNLTIYQTFVQRALVMLGAGVKVDEVPEAINLPVGAILEHDDILQKYYAPGSPLQYSRPQEEILVAYSQGFAQSEFKRSEMDQVLVDGTTIVFENPLALTAVKTSLSKMICRFPLKYCPFLIVHRYALTFIWKLFEGAIALLAPVPPENGFSPEFLKTNAETVRDHEYTDILPTLELLIKILTAAAEMEAVAQESMTLENARYYAQLGLGSFASVVKKLLFGKYAIKEIDDANRDIILEKMIKDGEEEEKQMKIEAAARFAELEKKREEAEAQQGNNDEEEEESEEECDDFETFAEEAEDPALKKANRRKMDVKEFLQSLPPQKREYNTNMIAAGAANEAELDFEGNKSLKARVLLLMLSPHYRAASLLQELLYKIAGESTDEYIRLCGFGRAVGLLTGKGIPGFAHLAQNAMSLDSLMGGR